MLFLGGLGRSGTTVLERLLDRDDIGRLLLLLLILLLDGFSCSNNFDVEDCDLNGCNFDNR